MESKSVHLLVLFPDPGFQWTLYPGTKLLFFLDSSKANFCKLVIVRFIQYFFNASFSYICVYLEKVPSLHQFSPGSGAFQYNLDLPFWLL